MDISALDQRIATPKKHLKYGYVWLCIFEKRTWNNNERLENDS